MPVDYATSLVAELERAADRIRDDIAKEGVTALKRQLDLAGFGKSEHLKDYDVLAHVTADDEIEFEILLDVESVRPEDMPNPPSVDDTVRKRIRTFAASGYGGVERVAGMRDQRRDARAPARDARRGARDARTKYHDHRRQSLDRTIRHVFSQYAPRGMRVDREGKLSVMFRKSMKKAAGVYQYPKGNFDGIVNDFVKRLEKIIADKFAPELEQIIQRWAGG